MGIQELGHLFMCKVRDLQELMHPCSAICLFSAGKRAGGKPAAPAGALPTAGWISSPAAPRAVPKHLSPIENQAHCSHLKSPGFREKHGFVKLMWASFSFFPPLSNPAIPLSSEELWPLNEGARQEKSRACYQDNLWHRLCGNVLPKWWIRSISV